MAIQIKLKNSVVQDSTPSTSDLPAVGEIALNANINSIGGFMRASDNTIVKIFGPGSLSTPTATTTVSGISELATNSETTTGTATNRVVTPAGLNAVTVAERSTSNSTYLALAGGTLTGVLAATAGSNSAPSIHFGDSDSGIYAASGGNNVRIAVGGSDAISASTGGGINFSLAAKALTSLTLGSQSATDKPLFFADANSVESSSLLLDNSSNEFRVRNNRFSGKIVFAPSQNTEKARIDNAGRLLVGQSASVNVGSTTAGFLQIASSTGTINSSFAAYGNNSSPCMIAIGRSRSGTVGSAGTALQDDDVIGLIRFAGDDGTDLQSQAASIAVEVDGTPGSNDMPGRLVFGTTADGAATPTERLRIDSSGFVGVGETSPDELLHIKDTATNCRLKIENTNNTVAGITLKNSEQEFAIQANSSQLIVYDATDSATRVHLDTSGNVSLGGTSPSTQSAKFQTRGTSQNATRINMHHEGNSSASISANGGLAFGSDTANGTTERMRLDSSGRLLLGISSDSSTTSMTISGNSSNSAGQAQFHMDFGSTSVPSDTSLGIIRFRATGDNRGADIRGVADGTWSAGSSHPTRLGFYTNPASSASTPTERMRITSDGRVFIGSTSPAAAANADDLCIGNNDGSGETGITLGSNTASGIRFADGGSNSAAVIEYSHGSTNAFIFSSEGSERMRIDSNGNVGLSLTPTSGAGVLQLNGGLRIAGSANASDTSGPYIFRTSGSDNMVFATSGSERLRISNTGLIGIGTSSPDSILDITSDTPLITFNSTVTGLGANNLIGGMKVFKSDASGSGTGICGGLFWRSNDSFGARSYLQITNRQNSTGETNTDTESLRITGTGVVRIKCEDFSVDPSSSNRGVMIGNSSTGTVFSNGSSTSNANNIIFINGNGVVGKISTSGSGTNYEETSDYRLKENEVVISDGITRLKQLKPYRFNFKADASTTVDGFFAHEAQQVVPEAVSGTKDEMENVLYTEEDTIPSGKKIGDVKETVPKYQGIDHSKLVPLLVAAVQELIGKVEALEAA